MIRWEQIAEKPEKLLAWEGEYRYRFHYRADRTWLRSNRKLAQDTLSQTYRDLSTWLTHQGLVKGDFKTIRGTNHLYLRINNEFEDVAALFKLVHF